MLCRRMKSSRSATTPPTENIHHPEPMHLRMFHHLVTIQANAYQNGTWVLATATAGKEDGFGLIGGSAIIAPTGEIAARALGEDDEVITATLDLDLGDYIKPSSARSSISRSTVASSTTG
jgi:N-carbamoyl-D-amino-acid hydrolase